MAASVTDFASTFLEKVRPNLQSLLDMNEANAASYLVKKGSNVIPVNERVARIPLLVQNGGDFGTVDLDGGALGSGSGMKFTHMESTYVTTKLSFEVTAKSIYATDSRDKALVDVMKTTMENAIKEFNIYDDILWHNQTGSQGVLAKGDGTTAVSATTNPAGANDVVTYTLDSAFSSQLFRVGQPVEIYDSTLATQKTVQNSPDTLPRVTAFNVSARTVTLTFPAAFNNSYKVTAANTDYIVQAGLSLGSATSKLGLYHFNNTATTGLLCNVNRATYPEINSNWVTASGTLIPLYIMLLKHRILQRRGAMPTDLVGICHPAQQAAIAQYGLTWSTWNRGNADKMIDPLPNIGDNIAFGGINFKSDIRANRTRMDVISPSTWGRTRLKDTDFFEVDGRRIFENRNATGGVKASMQFHLILAENFYCADPGSQGFITGLTPPSGY